jgi:transketolase
MVEKEGFNMQIEEREQLKQLAKRVRRSILSMIYEAQSGHPGGSLSAADIMTVLYFKELRIQPTDPTWHDRDRFVLSKGHACPVWYVCLQMRGFFAEEHLHSLRTVNSILQGHPDMKKTPGVDMTTGSLGLGVAAALGMALEGKLEGSARRVYAIVGDGELNEGVVWETIQAAYKFNLDNFCMIVDKNGLQLDGPVDEIMPIHDLSAALKGFGWHVIEIDGHNFDQIADAFTAARRVIGKPSCILACTIKGKGVSFMENQLKWHGKAPDSNEFQLALGELS